MNDSNLTNELRRIAVTQEAMGDTIKTILEIVAPMRKEVTEIKSVIADIPEMKADIKTIKAVIRDTNQQVQNHEKRLTRLETKAA